MLGLGMSLNIPRLLGNKMEERRHCMLGLGMSLNIQRLLGNKMEERRHCMQGLGMSLSLPEYQSQSLMTYRKIFFPGYVRICRIPKPL